MATLTTANARIIRHQTDARQLLTAGVNVYARPDMPGIEVWDYGNNAAYSGQPLRRIGISQPGAYLGVSMGLVNNTQGQPIWVRVGQRQADGSINGLPVRLVPITYTAVQGAPSVVQPSDNAEALTTVVQSGQITFNNLAMVKAAIKRGRDAGLNMDAEETRYNQLVAEYNAAQQKLTTSGWFTDARQQASDFAKRLLSWVGIGIVPLLAAAIPVAVDAVLALGAIAAIGYALSQIFGSSNTSTVRSMDLYNEICQKLGPDCGKLRQLVQETQTASSGGFFGGISRSIGSAALWVGLGFGAYVLYKNRKGAKNG